MSAFDDLAEVLARYRAFLEQNPARPPDVWPLIVATARRVLTPEQAQTIAAEWRKAERDAA